MRVQGTHSVMFQYFGVDFLMEQICANVSLLQFSTSFSEACHVVLAIAKGLLVKIGENRSYSL